MASGSINLGSGQVYIPPQSYTATLSNSSSVSTSAFIWYRMGGWLGIDGQIAFSGAGTAAALTVALPTAAAGNPVIDTNALPGGTNTGNATSSLLGHGVWFDTGVAWKSIWPKYVTTTTFGFWDVNQAWANNEGKNGSSLNFRVWLPIVGW